MQAQIVAAGFEPVAEAFHRNGEERAELGAALCVIIDGQVVLDLWQGLRNRDAAAWAFDTCVPIFSAGKGAAAAAVLHAAASGLLELDRPVASFWPGFGAHGKEMITPRHILEHRSGLWRFGRVLGPQDLDDPARMTSILEEMQPQHVAGAATAYHLATFGCLLTQIIRRVDPWGRDLSRYFAEEIAAPLGLAIAFGADPAGAGVRAALAPPGLTQWTDVLLRAPAGLRWQLYNPFSRLHATLREVRLPVLSDDDWLAHDLPSGNAVATARGVAGLYAELATGGRKLGLSDGLLAQGPANDGQPDLVMGIRNRFRLGFAHPTPDFPFWDRAEAFGMSGLGGAFGFADPSRRLGYAYLPNRLGVMPFDDGREARLRQSLAQCLASAAET